MGSATSVIDSAEGILNTWGGLPIAFDNIRFDSQAQDDWVRITIVDGDSFKESIGCDRITRTGLVIVQIFTKAEKGARPARVYADTISALYANSTDGNIIYYTPSLTRVGSAEGFFQINVNVPFEVTE